MAKQQYANTEQRCQGARDGGSDIMTIHETKSFNPVWEDASVLVSDEHKYLSMIVRLTNELALDWNEGRTDSCISTSNALHYVLRELGYPASLVRVTTAVFPDAPKSWGTVLGSDQRSTAASPGMWSGHLCCAVGFDWLLDATLDQANKPEWGDAKVRPLAIPVHSTFFEGKTIFLSLPGIRFRYSIFAKQKGWVSPIYLGTLNRSLLCLPSRYLAIVDPHLLIIS